MANQSILEVTHNDLHLFLQNGFFDFSSCTPLLHSHGYTEIHLVIKGQLRFFIGKKEYAFAEGTILAIPRNVYHYCIEKADTAQSLAFQIEKNISTLQTHQISPEIIRAFVPEIVNAKSSGNYTVVSRYISLFCSFFLDDAILPPVRSTDSSLIINEFFSNRYNQKVTLATLAQELNLSEKQTARLVKKHTGNTFNQELTRRRISVADHLIQSTKMTLSEIAEYVGFKSYSGFWKVYKVRQSQPD